MNKHITEHIVYDLESFYYITYNKFEDKLVQEFYYQKYNKKPNRGFLYISASSWNTVSLQSESTPISNKLKNIFEEEYTQDKPIVISVSSTSENFKYSVFDETDIPNYISKVNVHLYYAFKRWLFNNLNIKVVRAFTN